MIQGKEGMSNYQIFPKFLLGGKPMEAVFQFPELGKLNCIYLRTFKPHGASHTLKVQKIIAIEEKDTGAVKTEVSNHKNLQISQHIPDMSLCAGLHESNYQTPTSLPEQRPGTPMDAQDIHVSVEKSLCTNFKNGLAAEDEERIMKIDC